MNDADNATNDMHYSSDDDDDDDGLQPLGFLRKPQERIVLPCTVLCHQRIRRQHLHGLFHNIKCTRLTIPPTD